MEEIEEIKNKVLQEVAPSEREIEATKDKFNEIKEFIAQKFNKEAVLMGSVAKNTFLKGDKDLDIFVFFPEEVEKEKLEEEGLKVGKTVFDQFGGDYAVEYAEHPYTKGQIDNFEVEIVPCCQVESGSDLKSSVDRTPFHTRWVNDHLSQEEKQEVIILKKFLKGLGLYGSSLKTKGFSGYLCELLIYKYGSLESLIAAAPDWQRKEKIDPEGHWQSDTGISVPKHLWQRFKEDILVVIDPVDPERNVASVLSHENYSKFIYECWKFNRQPASDYFFPSAPKEPDLKRIKRKVERRGQMLVIESEKPDEVVDDILYPQLRKAMRRIDKLLAKHEFELFDQGLFVDSEAGKIRLLFNLKVWKLPPARKRQGPRVYHNSQHLKQFTDKYDYVWVEDDRLVTIIDRDHQQCQDLLRNFLSQDDLEGKGVPSHLAQVLEEGEVRELKAGDIKQEDKNWNQFLNRFFRLGADLKSEERP